MELTYADKEYRTDVLKYIKENYKYRKDQTFGAKVFAYFIHVLKKNGENTEKFGDFLLFSGLQFFPNYAKQQNFNFIKYILFYGKRQQINQ